MRNVAIVEPPHRRKNPGPVMPGDCRWRSHHFFSANPEYMHVCHIYIYIYFQMVCQKLCQNNVLAGSLEEIPT